MGPRMMAVTQRRATNVIPSFRLRLSRRSASAAAATPLASGPRSAPSATRTTAMCKSFFGTLECELLDRHRFATPAAARLDVFEYLEGWNSPHRRHSALNCGSPVNYERRQLPSFPLPPHGVSGVRSERGLGFRLATTLPLEQALPSSFVSKSLRASFGSRLS